VSSGYLDLLLGREYWIYRFTVRKGIGSERESWWDVTDRGALIGCL
jgi:hypothetical protein